MTDNKPSTDKETAQLPDTDSEAEATEFQDSSKTLAVGEDSRPSPPPQTVRVPDEHTPPAIRWGDALIEGRIQLQITVKGYEGAAFLVTMSDRVVIGRAHEEMDEKPDVDLTTFDAQAKGVSRQHAALLKEEDMLKIIDLGSTNGTFLNGTRMSPNQARILRDGDELRLGRLTLKVAFVKA